MGKTTTKSFDMLVNSGGYRGCLPSWSQRLLLSDALTNSLGPGIMLILISLTSPPTFKVTTSLITKGWLGEPKREESIPLLESSERRWNSGFTFSSA